MERYGVEVERLMKSFYDSLSEKDRRRYAAIEAEKLGHGGVSYVSQILECAAATIRAGGSDVRGLPVDEAADRVRKKGRPKAS